MTSQDRLMAAINGEPGAPIPCSFMIFTALAERCRNYQELALAEAELGLDARVPIADLPIRFAPEVQVEDICETSFDGSTRLLRRTYHTPAGCLSTTIRKNEGWPYGDRVPLFGDHLVPRAVKHLVTSPADLEPLRALLGEPSADDLAAFRQDAAGRARFADENGLLLTGGWSTTRGPAGERSRELHNLIGSDYGTSTLGDALMWLCGATEPLLWAYDEPDFLEELILLLENYNRRRLEIHLETDVRLVFRRAWYEGTEFWSPQLYRRFLFPALKREAELCHQAGIALAYIITSGMLPLADLIVEAGVDVVVGVDPGQGKGTTLEAVRDRLGGRITLWGGVSGPLAIEQGDEAEVRAAVEEAVTTLGPTDRFILSPVDNVTESTETTWHNVTAFVDTWRRTCGG